MLKSHWHIIRPDFFSSKPDHIILSQLHTDRAVTFLPEAKLRWVSVDLHILTLLQWIIHGEVDSVSIELVVHSELSTAVMLGLKEFKIRDTVEPFLPSLRLAIIEYHILVLENSIMHFKVWQNPDVAICPFHGGAEIFPFA